MSFTLFLSRGCEDTVVPLGHDHGKFKSRHAHQPQIPWKAGLLEWHNRFSEGPQEVEDDERLGRPVIVRTEG